MCPYTIGNLAFSTRYMLVSYDSKCQEFYVHLNPSFLPFSFPPFIYCACSVRLGSALRLVSFLKAKCGCAVKIFSTHLICLHPWTCVEKLPSSRTRYYIGFASHAVLCQHQTASSRDAALKSSLNRFPAEIK